MITLRLTKDLSRDIKRGHPWVYQGALKMPLPKESGFAKLLDKKGQMLAWGVYDAKSPLCFRVVHHGKGPINEKLIESRLKGVILRKTNYFNSKETTGYRLINGEGDGFPGVICDVYGPVAVLQTDGIELDKVWNLNAIAEQIKISLSLSSVVFKPQKGKGETRVVLGDSPAESVRFLENGIQWSADIWKGQKTGFFLDQRNSRKSIRQSARSRSVLNLFSYTGGFSVSAGMGGASRVTSVDISNYAVEACSRHWLLNDLDSSIHTGHALDVFDFLQKNKDVFDLVIVDPPSFASSKSNVEKALQSYVHIFSQAAKIVEKNGLLALSSCSSHVDFEMFYQLCIDSVSKARRRARIISIQGQPEDHPFPLACTELRYLKFFMLQLN